MTPEIQNGGARASEFGLATLLVTLLVVWACKDKALNEAPPESGDNKAASRDAAAAPVKHLFLPVEIDELGLIIDVPADAQMSENEDVFTFQGKETTGEYAKYAPGWKPGGATRPALLISVAEVHSDLSVTMAEFVDTLGGSCFFLLKREVEGGWDIAYDYRSWDLFEPISDYQVHVRRTINGKTFDCRTASPGKSDKTQQESALLACRTLRSINP